jgi:IS4 transposase
MAGRVCAIRKSEQATAMAHRRIELKAVRKYRKTKAETWEYAKYAAVFTTHVTALPPEILERRRPRWQIGLVFKRLKSRVATQVRLARAERRCTEPHRASPGPAAVDPLLT